MRFEQFDQRGYPTVDVRTGYREWAGSYEQTVRDEMDIVVLEELTSPMWSTPARVLDVGCGTGRTGHWLRGKTTASIDGVDLTPEMLAAARARGIYDKLVEADVTDTGLPDQTYDVLVASLIDEHLADLRAFYAETWRVAAPEATFVLVGLHPQFFMAAGMPTHFKDDTGQNVAITTNVHLISDHVTSALASGWRLGELRESVVDDRWINVKPKWARLRGYPVSAAYVWRK